MSFIRTVSALFIATAAIAVSGCNTDTQSTQTDDTATSDGNDTPATLAIEGATIRFSPIEGNPAAIYFKIKGGPSDTTLVSIDVEGAQRAELHESTETDGVTSMNKVDEIAVPAGETVVFAPGGYHAMVFGMTKPKADTAPFTANFSDGERLQGEAKITSLGMDMSGHKNHDMKM